jgi:hypothetical protein
VLEDETHDVIARAGALGGSRVVERTAMHEHVAGGWLLEAAQHIQQRRFARTRLAAEENFLPGGDFDVHSAQDGQIMPSEVVGAVHILCDEWGCFLAHENVWVYAPQMPCGVKI